MQFLIIQLVLIYITFLFFLSLALEIAALLFILFCTYSVSLKANQFITRAQLVHRHASIYQQI